jgi:hypothetical protein
LALWCVAKPAVVVELFDTWTCALARLPEPRRRPVIDCALRCSAGGWVSKLPTDLKSADPSVSALLGFRNPTPPTTPETTSTDRRTPPRTHGPLIEVARDRKWFKVDEEGAYR